MYTTLTIIDILFAVILIFYGVLYLAKPPKFNGKNALSTVYTRQSEEAWAYGHKVGGKLMLAYGVGLAVLCLVKRALCGPQCSGLIRNGYTILEILLVVSVVIIMDWRVKARYGLKEK